MAIRYTRYTKMDKTVDRHVEKTSPDVDVGTLLYYYYNGLLCSVTNITDQNNKLIAPHNIIFKIKSKKGPNKNHD